jgi:predicted RNA-binding protein (virulence factor B family)
MIEIGRRNTLSVHSLSDRGALLGDGDAQVLLPAHEIACALEPGQPLEVFVFTTNQGPTATLATPALELGGFAYLEVLEVGEHGAFVDWGLPKDLLVPFGNQYAPMEPGRRYVVGLRLHRKTMRLVGTTVLSGLFDDEVDHLSPGDEVDLMVYGRIDQGYQVIVNGRHAGLVYRDQTYQRLRYGDTLRGWVDRVRTDHRVDIVLQRPGRAGTDDACSAILGAIDEAGGRLPLHDGSSPAAIKQRLQMSKKAFKKAVGRLYKARLIELDDQGIRRKS